MTAGAVNCAFVSKSIINDNAINTLAKYNNRLDRESDLPTKLQRHAESLEADELAFLERKEMKERRIYYRVYLLLLLFSFIIPFAGSWYRETENAPNEFSPIRFFVSAGLLVCISSIATFVTYLFNLRKVQLDIGDKTKTIEISHVTRKAYFPSQETYFLYIDSKIKMSIEVKHEDFVRLGEGDEVCIEFTTHSKQYLGYF